MPLTQEQKKQFKSIGHHLKPVLIVADNGLTEGVLAELDRALRLKSLLIGINNRNLKTFDLSLDVTRELAPAIPADRDIVCESGLFAPSDLGAMMQVGARRFLIGESLMRQTDVTAATRHILDIAA